jgi:uncharacterized protein (DUF1800 family)
MRMQRCLGWVFALVCLGMGMARAQDAVFSGGFESRIPASDAEAARFLDQATFGNTNAQIARLRQIGLEAWFAEQVAAAPSGHRRPLEALALTLAANTALNRDDRLRQWYRVAVLGNDQLRQRVAYALSQVLVVSDASDALSGEPLLVAEWNDMLARHALGNYRDLLIDVTRSPAMGRYLTHLRNRKVEGTVAPDENYAREIMQLFSIGLFERELDYSPILVGGSPVPTYDNDMIAALARVFTGLSHDCTGNAEVFPGAGVTIVRNCAGASTCTGSDCRFTNTGQLFFNSPPTDGAAANLLPGTTPLNRGLRHPDWFRPMVCYPRYHDTGRQAAGNSPVGTPPAPWTGVLPQPGPNKNLSIAGQLLRAIEPIPSPPQTAPNRALNCNDTGTNISAPHRAQCLAYCENSIDDAVNLLFTHPNTSSFVARQLIQRLTTSNPSPAYVRRVACAFEGTTAQAGECPARWPTARGDMRSVVQAVLFDIEARRPVAEMPVNAGKPREPILKLVQLWRTFDAVLPATSLRGGFPTGLGTAYAQRPLGAPSVFNFYEPDYKQAGRIATTGIDGQPSASGLFSPEFQIINEVSVIDTANDLFGRVCAGYGGNNCNGAFAATAPTDRVYLPPAALDALPISDGSAASDAALIEAINLRLMGGTMSGTIALAGTCPTPTPLTAMLGTGMKGRLFGMLRCTTLNTLNATQDNRRRKALYLIHLVMVSPEYATQR